MHDESDPTPSRVVIVCAHCGASKLVWRCDAGRRYCSRECSWASKRGIPNDSRWFAGDLRPVMLWRVDRDTGCWIWLNCYYDTGYGQFSSMGRHQSSHRAVWRMLRGPIEKGLHLDHLCRVRGCCNPDHLEPVTPQVNIARRGTSPTAISAQTGMCKRGLHRLEGDNLYDNGKQRLCRTCRREYRREYFRKHPEMYRPKRDRP